MGGGSGREMGIEKRTKRRKIKRCKRRRSRRLKKERGFVKLRQKVEEK